MGEWGERGGAAGEEGGEMFQKKEGPEGVYLESLEGILVGDLRRGFFRVKDAGKAECEAEVVGRGGEAVSAVGGGGGDGRFV